MNIQSNAMTERATLSRVEDRRAQIVRIVQENQRVAVDDLAAALAISRETIRRDLNELAAQGRLRKIHGGATLADPRLIGADAEGAFQTRLLENTAAKRAIARSAVQLFEPGDTLFVDTGTTTLFFAEELAAARGLTIITNSAAIAALAARGNANTTYLIGGEYRSESSENLGPLTVEQIGRFHANNAVIAIGSVETDGVFDFDLKEADVARAMIAQSRSVTVLADASKFGRGGLIKITPLANIGRIVTESRPPKDIAAALKNAGVAVIVA